jgi:hypothetical protein
MQSAIDEYIKEAQTSPEELMDLQFLDKMFETISEEELAIFAKYPALEFVNLANVGLKAVSSQFPANTKISCLIMSNNQLTDDVIETLAPLSELETLGLDGNSIDSLEKFKLLTNLPLLREIALEGNPITESVADYRAKLFAMIPQLQIVDDVDRDGNVIEDEFSEGDSDSEEGLYTEDDSDDNDEEDDEEDDDAEEESEDDNEEGSDDAEETGSPSAKKSRGD